METMTNSNNKLVAATLAVAAVNLAPLPKQVTDEYAIDRLVALYERFLERLDIQDRNTADRAEQDAKAGESLAKYDQLLTLRSYSP
jgi:hypothetical protein